MAEGRKTPYKRVQASATALTYDLVRFLKLPQEANFVDIGIQRDDHCRTAKRSTFDSRNCLYGEPWAWCLPNL
jgi:hypothetical protein